MINESGPRGAGDADAAQVPFADAHHIPPPGVEQPRPGEASCPICGGSDGRCRADREQEDANLPGPRPVTVRLADVEPEPVSWLCPERIARGKVTLLAGDPGLGKSFLTLDLAACVSTGRAWPHRRDAADGAGGVVLLSAEDELADTIRPRLDAAGADPARIVALQGVRVHNPETGDATEHAFDLVRDIEALETAITRVPDCRLCIIDPLTAYLGPIDSHKNAEVRAALARLSGLAARHNVAVLCVTHLNKAATLPAMYRAMGSLAFVAAARAVWVVARDKDDPTGQRRLLLPLKNNIAVDQSGLAYALESAPNGSAVVAWDANPITVDANEALSADHNDDGASNALDEAVDWLRGILAGGPVPAKDVKQRAQRDGIAPRTLDRAKARLGVRATREGFGGPWVWRLPEPHSAPTSPKSATLENVAHYDDVGALRVAPGCVDGEGPPGGIDYTVIPEAEWGSSADQDSDGHEWAAIGL